MLDAVPHRLDDARALVAEQHGQRVPKTGAYDMEVGATDAARVDANESFPRARLVELQLLDAEPADVGQDDAAIHEESRSRAVVPPMSASVRSVSAIRCRTTASTPSCPPTASP